MGKYNPKDHYFLKAKKESYAARSVYKLEEIDRRLRIFRPSQKVLDLGASPGSWSQYISKRVGERGLVVAIDLQPLRITLPNFHFKQADLRDVDFSSLLKDLGMEQFDVVVSDMAPKTTGIRHVDQARSMELCELALSISQKILIEGGSFVCKLFHGADFKLFVSSLKQNFNKVDIIKPDSTRSASKEIFLVGIGKKS